MGDSLDLLSVSIFSLVLYSVLTLENSDVQMNHKGFLAN